MHILARLYSWSRAFSFLGVNVNILIGDVFQGRAIG
jgi:hypothetical protein